MTPKEWGIPLLLGVITAGLVSLVPTPAPETADPPATEADPIVAFVFEEGPRMAAPRGEVLVLAGTGHPATIGWADGRMFNTTTAENRADITWAGDVGTIAIDQQVIYCVSTPCPQPEAPWLTRFPAEGPVVGPGNETVDVTFYVFDEQGLLVTSNDAAFRVDRFSLHSDYSPLSAKRWYLGNTTAPAGVSVLPFGTDVARAAFDGLGTGAVATAYIESHPYDWYIGPIWLTARIDAVD